MCETKEQVTRLQLGVAGVGWGVGGCEKRPLDDSQILTHPLECLGAEGRLAHKLFRDLFANYTSALRPVADTDQTLNVTLEVTLSQIIDMV